VNEQAKGRLGGLAHPMIGGLPAISE